MNTLGLNELVPLMKILFEEGKTVKLLACGRSMSPLLKDGVDSVILAKCQNPRSLKRCDVPLYHRQDGKYVLHRIVKKTKTGFWMCGDAQWDIEKEIPFENIDAVAVGFIKGKKEIKTSHIGYKLYSFFWVVALPFRGLIFKAWRRLRKGKNEK